MFTAPQALVGSAGLLWFKSSASSEEGACVEAARMPQAMAVRDSKVPESAVQVYAGSAWSEFLRLVSGSD